MPIEERRIIFSKAELYAALDRHLAGTGSGLPAGVITQVRGDVRGDLVKIDVATSEDDTAATVEFPATEVGEALIGHCVTNQIPLPRAFSKSLIITGDKVALQITNAAGGLVEKSTIWRSLRRRLIETLAMRRVSKWSLIRASVYGLAFQILVLWLLDRAWGADQWGRVTFDLDSGTWQGMAMAISALLPVPSLFVVGTWVRNAIVTRAKRRYRYSPKTLDFRFDKHHQAAPLSTALFALALMFLIVVLGGPLVVSQFEHGLQAERSTPSVALSSPTLGGAFSSSPSSQSGPLVEPRSVDNRFSAGGSSDSDSPPPTLLMQKGTVRLSGSSAVEVKFPERFSGIPNVVLVPAGISSAGVLPRVESITPTSFVIRQASGEGKRDSQTEFEWIARGPSPE
jgi:hypothetical protein